MIYSSLKFTNSKKKFKHNLKGTFVMYCYKITFIILIFYLEMDD